MLISKVGAEHYEQKKKIIMAGQHMVSEPAEGLKIRGEGASSNMVGTITLHISCLE